jgi:hypothetical protein
MTVRVYVITTAPPLFLGDLRYGLSGAQVARYGPRTPGHHGATMS